MFPNIGKYGWKLIDKVRTEKNNDLIHDEINGVICADCNFSNSASSKYCNQCGSKLNDLTWINLHPLIEFGVIAPMKLVL